MTHHDTIEQMTAEKAALEGLHKDILLIAILVHKKIESLNVEKEEVDRVVQEICAHLRYFLRSSYVGLYTLKAHAEKQSALMNHMLQQSQVPQPQIISQEEHLVLRKSEVFVGKWLSAAIEDVDHTCVEMREDAQKWFDLLKPYLDAG